ncbi:hypothetical protein M011DRAFT_468044 [Sporormia fimetaria CBS 119925]|uniref:Zn(2)-C6 fungal-type domain-containing protein n=1 Tax=Sporormia fimetaria CBS 119925 TaxID=1340428 RepID=A0A6A6VBP4_9PLEO|nr:hypothetical protein M011DRAFT_468044 [Sporormia fimetaria CBS 119925]
MVYTGKPSKACQKCKDRRIKCDLNRPACERCTKAGHICPGYRHEFDVMHRAENKALEKKLHRKDSSGDGPKGKQAVDMTMPSSSSAPLPSDSDVQAHSEPALELEQTMQLSIMPIYSTQALDGSSSGPNPDSYKSYSGSPPLTSTSSGEDQPKPDEEQEQNMQLSIGPRSSTHSMAGLSSGSPVQLDFTLPPTLAPEVEALAFFFNNFIPISLPQQPENMRGYLELLVPLYSRAMPSSALHLATKAVAFATVGNYPGKQELLQQAFTSYGKALKKLNRDMNDPVSATSDESVVTALLFSLFETIMTTNNSIAGWGTHVDGAVELTKLRGIEQLNDPMSSAVFKAVRTIMITSCVQRSKPIDAFPWKIQGVIRENAANRLTLICIDLPNIRAKANILTSTPYNMDLEREAYAIMTLAQEVDIRLQEWHQSLPQGWQPRTIRMILDAIEKPEDIANAENWFGPQHVYQDVHTATLINDYRTGRIYCHQVMLACMKWLDQGFNGLDLDGPIEGIPMSVFVIQQMVDEISASVPFHLDYDLQPAAQRKGTERNAAEAFGGFSLMWPLFVSANADTVPQPQRDWLSGRLKVIGQRFGLSSAHALALTRSRVLGGSSVFTSQGLISAPGGSI